MSDLDAKLMECGITAPMIPHVKQAFSEARWIPEAKGAFLGDEKWKALVKEEVLRLNLMTGQQWYDRFEKELYKLATVGNFVYSNDNINDLLAAARRASGMS